MDADGSNQRALASDPLPDRSFSPAWSSDGEDIVFVRFRGGDEAIWVMEANGSNKRQVTDGTEDDRQPRYSPDGRQIVFSRGCDLYVIDIDGSNLSQVIDTPDWCEYDPIWSPDGNRIMYTTQEGSVDFFYRAWTIAADGSDRRQLSPHVARFPEWSPDGSQIVFVSADDLGPGLGFETDLYVMNADGSNARRIALAGAENGRLSWSPAGDLIAFQTVLGVNEEIGIVGADGSNLTILSSGSGAGLRDFEPAWRP